MNLKCPSLPYPDNKDMIFPCILKLNVESLNLVQGLLLVT